MRSAKVYAKVQQAIQDFSAHFAAQKIVRVPRIGPSLVDDMYIP
jgi:hypothetical protein